MPAFTLDPSAVGAILLDGLAQGGLGLALFDRQDRLAFGNATFLELFPPTGRTQPWRDLLSARGGRRHQWTKADERQEIEAHTRAHRGLTLSLPDGTVLLVREIEHPDGWLIVLVSDITPIKANERALLYARDEALRAANTDVLTGLFNRRFIQEKLKAWVRTPVSAYFCACLIDLDRFKSINDTYGHMAGDQTIEHFARQAQSCLRPIDLLGRLGGDEFLLLLPDIRAEDSLIVMARLKERIAEGFTALSGQKIRYTFSAGIAMNQPGDAWQDLLQRADSALYTAKWAGRDRWEAVPC